LDLNDPLTNVLITAIILGLIPLGYFCCHRTKSKAKAGVLGEAAIFLGSLISPHATIVKEVKASIRNKVRKKRSAG